MSKTGQLDIDDFEFVEDDGDFSFEEYQRSKGKFDIRRGIEDYFDRQQMKTLDDWFEHL